MIYCQTCGQQNADQAQYCIRCGATITARPQQNTYGYQQPVQEDKPETGLCVLSFFFWIVGVVLYAVYINTKPVAAKAYLKWGIISVSIGVGLGLVFGFLMPILFFSASPFVR